MAPIKTRLDAFRRAVQIIFAPSGGIAATNVQEAIEELDADITSGLASKQPLDDTLTSISALGTAADKYIFTDGTDSWLEGDITAAGRALLDDANAAAQTVTLGLEIGVDVQAYDAQLDDLAGLAPDKGNLVVGDGSNWISLGVGTDTHVLTADALEASGIKWAAQAGTSSATTTTEGIVELATAAEAEARTDTDRAPTPSALANFALLDEIGTNRLCNADFTVAQRGASGSAVFDATTTPANDDDTVLLDRWVLLSNGNDIVDVSQEGSVVPDDGRSAVKLDVETANAKFGLLQIVENAHCQDIIGNTCSFSFQARKSGTTTTRLRAAVVSWTAGLDVVTSDLVSAWGAEGVDPTLVGGWVYESTPSTLTLTDSYQTFTIENVSIDQAGTDNIAVFIWADETGTTVGDLVYISNCQLNAGEHVGPFQPRSMPRELDLCRRRYTKTFSLAVAPGEGLSQGWLIGRGQVPSSAEPVVNWRFTTAMAGVPTVTLYQPESGQTSGEWKTGASASANARAIGASTDGVVIDNTGIDPATSGVQAFIQATAEIEL